MQVGRGAKSCEGRRGGPCGPRVVAGRGWNPRTVTGHWWPWVGGMHSGESGLGDACLGANLKRGGGRYVSSWSEAREGRWAGLRLGRLPHRGLDSGLFARWGRRWRVCSEGVVTRLTPHRVPWPFRGEWAQGGVGQGVGPARGRAGSPGQEPEGKSLALELAAGPERKGRPGEPGVRADHQPFWAPAKAPAWVMPTPTGPDLGQGFSGFSSAPGTCCRTGIRPSLRGPQRPAQCRSGCGVLGERPGPHHHLTWGTPRPVGQELSCPGVLAPKAPASCRSSSPCDTHWIRHLGGPGSEA